MEKQGVGGCATSYDCAGYGYDEGCDGNGVYGVYCGATLVCEGKLCGIGGIQVNREELHPPTKRELP